MAHERVTHRAAAALAIAALIAACSAASVPSDVPQTSSAVASAPLASPASPTAAPSAEPTAAPSHKPRPSLDIELEEIDAYLTSSITFLDLADDDLAVVVTYIDPGSETPFPLGTYTLESMDQVTNDAPPGTYVLEFHQPAGSATSTSCTVEIADEEGYVFAALGDAIAISTTGTTPTDTRELFVATSSLCAA